MQIEESSHADSTIPKRTLKLNANEIYKIMGIETQNKPNSLERLAAILQKNEESHKNEMLKNDFEKLQKLVNEGATAAKNEMEEENSLENSVNEPHLPQTEGIVTQYAARPLFLMYNAENLSEEDMQLSSHYWLTPMKLEDLKANDFETQYERIACDLTELSNSCLGTDTNLSSDCKRVLHLSASPQSNRERTPTAPCFRTRRVEVDSTGRPEKKIYITPVRGRGFPRPPPSRGDLFRSRPPNTSRPPSLHVDDFLALETCGAQPTGPTGYNKIPSLMRGSRVGRNRGSRLSASAAYR